jgi:hypothetical protein
MMIMATDIAIVEVERIWRGSGIWRKLSPVEARRRHDSRAAGTMFASYRRR